MKVLFPATLGLLLFSATALFAQQVTYPPGTGVSHSLFGGLDTDDNWSIIFASISEETPPGIPEVAARVIPANKRGGGWFAPATGSWIGPDSDQTNATRGAGCCGGVTTFQLEFTVTDVKQQFAITFCADDYTDILLNGNVIYNSTDLIFASCQTKNVTSGFQSGTNLLHFNVTNGNGPTGLYVSFGPIQNTTTSRYGASTAPGTYHLDALPDPIDGASGQFYENVSDIELGGPMNLGFRRYYSSLLASGKISTALGTNWMSNFDGFASVTSSGAQVLMPKGLIVSFTKSGSAWQLAAPKDVAYQFIQSGTSYQLLDPRNKLIYTFAANGTLSSIANRNGDTITVTQGANGPTQIADGLGRTLTLTYSGANLSKITDQAGRSASYVYTSGLLTSSTDIYNQTTKYNYTTVGSAAGLMTSKQLPLGNIPTTQTYDSQGRVLTQRIPGSDGNFYTTTLAYDANGGTTITDGLGKITKHVNSAGGNATQLTDPLGATAVLAYDGVDRRVSVTDKLGNKTSYTYDSASGYVASITDALGNATTFTYTAQVAGGFTFYDLTRVSYADGTSLVRTFDSRGNVLTETGRNGGVTKSAYDANGRIITLTLPNNQASTMTWNSDGTMASLTDAAGNKRTYAYDNTKRLISQVDPNGGKTTYVLDKATTGPMIAINSPASGGSSTIYDDQNRQLQDVVVSNGGTYHYDYTATGQLLDSKDPLKHVRGYAYDGNDRLSTITNAANEKVTYGYDAAGRVTSVSDPSGARLSYTYNAEGQVIAVTDGAGAKTTYAYDALGRVTSWTTPSGKVYKTTYDRNGNVTSTTNPLNETTSVTLDAAGLTKSITAPGGVTTGIGRDANEVVTSVTSANGNTSTFGRDANERLTKITDPLGQSTGLAYTGTQITQVTLPLGTVALTNDAGGNVVKQQFSDGTTFSNTYDSNGLLSATNGVTITRDTMGQPSNINGIGITLDGEGRPVTLTYATGKTVTYAYDSSGLLASITDWVGGKTTLNYDAAGKLASFTYPNGVTTTNTYDADGNLTKIAAGSLASIALTRDAAGKITAADRNLPTVPVLSSSSQQLTYDAAGQLASATYDTMGRVTAQGARTYTWNLASQMTSFKDGANSGSFTYDGLGEISSSNVSGVTETFVFNYLLDYPGLSIVRRGAADQRYYVYLPSGLLLYSVEAANNARHFYHFDEMGNTAFLTDDQGAVSDSYAITPYGEIAAHTGTTDNPFVWQGEFGVMQIGTGLFYMRDRYYDATTARFLSRDPEIASDPLSSEPYAYAGGNPMLYVDPYGNNIFTWIGDKVSQAANAAKNAAIAAATKAKELAVAAAAAAAKLVEDARKKLFPPPPPARPVTPAPPAKAPVVQPVQQRPAPVAPVTLIVPKAPSNGSSGGGSGTVFKVAPPSLLSKGNGLHLNALGYLVDAKGNLITNDGGSLITNDGGSLIGQDGNNVVSNDGGTLIVDGVMFVNVHGTLISQDGNNFRIAVPLIGQDGNNVIATDSAGIISDNSEGILSQGGGNAVSHDGGTD